MKENMIYLHDLWPMANTQDYTIHFAQHRKRSEPLDVCVRNKREWQAWQEYRPKQNHFNRSYIGISDKSILGRVRGRKLNVRGLVCLQNQWPGLIAWAIDFAGTSLYRRKP